MYFPHRFMHVAAAGAVSYMLDVVYVRCHHVRVQACPRHCARPLSAAGELMLGANNDRADVSPVSISTPNTNKTCRLGHRILDTPDYGPQGERRDSRRNREFHRLGLCDKLVPRDPMGRSRLRSRCPGDPARSAGAHLAHLSRPQLPAHPPISATTWSCFLGLESLEIGSSSSPKPTGLQAGAALQRVAEDRSSSR